MKTLSVLTMFAGFTPAFMTAVTTDGMFGLIDYASALTGFLCACTVLEMKGKRNERI